MSLYEAKPVQQGWSVLNLLKPYTMNIHQKINARQNANFYNILGLFAWVHYLLMDGAQFNRTRDVCLFQTKGYHRDGKNHSQYPGFFQNRPDKYALRYRWFATKQMSTDDFLYSHVPYLNQPVAMHGHMWLTHD